MIPTRSIVQSLAAAAVHDATAPFDDDVVAMTRAAGATRYAAVTIAAREAITSAGRCVPGDVLGVLEGDIVEIANDSSHVGEVALLLLNRLLQSGGELVTIVAGDGADGVLTTRVSRAVAKSHPGLEVAVFEGGQPFWPLILGVE